MAALRGSPRHVFIGGLHRSGTSVLHDMLRAHPAVTGFRDTGVHRDEGQYLQSVIEPDGAFGGPGKFCLDPRAHITDADRPRYAARLPTLHAQWAKHWAADRAIRVEKSPPNLIRSRFLQSAFEDARFVFIVRHPLAVARATVKWTHGTVEQALRHWFAAHRMLTDDARWLKRSVCVRYEDIALDLNAALGPVWAIMDAPPIETAQSLFEDRNGAYLDGAHDAVLSAQDRLVLAHFGYRLAAPFTLHERRYGW